MKTTITAPAVCSLEQNEIRNLFSLDDIPESVRIVHLEGTPVRIEICSGGNGSGEIQKYTEKEIKIDNYDFSKLSKVFYNTGYLYGFVKDNKIQIYDVFVNENFFSTKDLNFLKTTLGVPIVSPLKEGRISIKEAFDFFYNLKDIDYRDLYILPEVYINDTRNTSSSLTARYQKLFGEKAYVAYGYGNYPAVQPQTTFNDVGSLVDVAIGTEEKKKKPKVFLLSKKEERTSIFQETYKNVSTRLKSLPNVSKDILDWFEKKGRTFCYLYAIHTLPATRSIIYDYAFSCEFDDGFSCVENMETFWAWIFLDFFNEEFSKQLERTHKKIENDDYINFEFVFREELKVFNEFFEKEEVVSYSSYLAPKEEKEV